MSLAEITRNCFQSGIQAKKWLSLCKQFVAENSIIGTGDIVASSISNSVLFLYRSYPADPGLNSYLACAIKDGILPLPVFVSTFLQAARSPDLHSAATLDFLCDLALTTHEASGRLPLGSLVSPSEPPAMVLESVQDALALIRVSHTLPLSRHHAALAPNSEKLLVHLLSCVSDLSQVTVAQAFTQYSEVTDVLRDLQLDPALRSVLEGFAITLGVLIGDDAKAAREAQMMQSMQMAKGDVGGPNSETDVITLGLLWQYLVTHRAHEFGAGNSTSVVALLVSTWRWSSWSAQVFYTQAFVSAFTCLASNIGNPLLWKAFIVGRLPSLLASFQVFVSADPSLGVDWRASLRHGLRMAFRRPDLIVPGDDFISQATASNGANDGSGQSYTRALLQQLVKAELINQKLALELDPSLANESPSSLHAEAQDAGMDLTAYLEMKLTQETEMADATSWLDRIWRDVSSHNTFASLVLKRFSSFSTALDVESLSHLCKLLYTHPSALDLVALHIKMSDLIFYALVFLEEYDCETVGDPQTAVSHLGDVVLFVQYTLALYQLEQETFVKDGKSLSTEFLRCTDEVLPVESLLQAESASFHSWFKALFDSSSEGIEDTILRSTHPKILLRISATLFSQAIKAVSMRKIDTEVLLNGVSYFTGPLLNWTLVGVIKALVSEIQLSTNPTSATFDILQTLLMSSSCPRPVLALCSPPVLRYLSDKGNGIPICPSFDVAAVQNAVRAAAGRIGVPQDGSRNPAPWIQYPRDKIRAAMGMGQTHKIVEVDVDRCLKMMYPTKFLQILWSELSLAASLGELEVCRRVSTFVLTMPRNSRVPPLLPIFIHLVLPSLLTTIDKQVSQDQTPIVELITTIIFSSLTAALHLEWSMSTVLNDNRMILGAPSSAIARRLANDLRSRKNSRASNLILQRLSSSQSFVANFPCFGGELGG